MRKKFTKYFIVIDEDNNKKIKVYYYIFMN